MPTLFIWSIHSFIDHHQQHHHRKGSEFQWWETKNVVHLWWWWLWSWSYVWGMYDQIQSVSQSVILVWFGWKLIFFLHLFLPKHVFSVFFSLGWLYGLLLPIIRAHTHISTKSNECQKQKHHWPLNFSSFIFLIWLHCLAKAKSKKKNKNNIEWMNESTPKIVKDWIKIIIIISKAIYFGW